MHECDNSDTVCQRDTAYSRKSRSKDVLKDVRSCRNSVNRTLSMTLLGPRRSFVCIAQRRIKTPPILGAMTRLQYDRYECCSLHFHGLGKVMLIHLMNLCHVPLPVVLSWKGLATGTGVVASLNGTVKLLLLLMPVIDMPLQVCLGAESLATGWVGTLVIFAVVSLVMLELMWLIENLFAANLITTKH